MHSITFYPLGNADSIKIDLSNGRSLLFDYASTHNPEAKDDLRIDLASQLRSELSQVGKNFFDVVAFTHLDDDHISGSTDFFHLNHALKYQGNDRIKIKDLWVPAAAIIEPNLTGEKRIIQNEAQFRLREGKGVRIFSHPFMLEKWLKTNGLTVSLVEHLITDAGQIIPDFTPADDELELFTHSPFAMRSDEGEIVDRNRDALVVHATLGNLGVKTKIILASDVNHEVIDDIVRATQRNNNEDRLEWNIVKIPHHCSYLSIGPEKGKLKTDPTDLVKWLYETQGHHRGCLISTSDPIPNQDAEQPPHIQAAEYYREIVNKKNGEFLVTMEHPNKNAPKPLKITIDNQSGATVKKIIGSGATIMTSHKSPRAG